MFSWCNSNSLKEANCNGKILFCWCNSTVRLASHQPSAGGICLALVMGITVQEQSGRPSQKCAEQSSHGAKPSVCSWTPLLLCYVHSGSSRGEEGAACAGRDTAPGADMAPQPPLLSSARGRARRSQPEDRWAQRGAARTGDLAWCRLSDWPSAESSQAEGRLEGLH